MNSNRAPRHPLQRRAGWGYREVDPTLPPTARVDPPSPPPTTTINHKPSADLVARCEAYIKDSKSTLWGKSYNIFESAEPASEWLARQIVGVMNHRTETNES